jgi:KUP system potassium uptake protein
VLLTAVASQRWHWGLASLALAAAFLPLDLAFLGSNLLKLAHGGWFSLAVAALGFTIMSTWQRGRQVLEDRLEETSLPLELFLPDLDTAKLPRAPHCGVFLTGNPRGTPHALLHNVKHNQVVHSPTLLLTVLTADEPAVRDSERVTVQPIQPGFVRVVARYGFMEVPNVPEILERIRSPQLLIEPLRTSYFVGREKLIPRGASGMGRWRERLFALMAGNAQAATSFFRIPANQVVELGAQVEL